MVFFEDKNGDGLLVTELDAPTNPDELEVIQRLWYYPFGMHMEGIGQQMATPDQPYRYNGKELDEATGLYDYGARWYDPAVARWGQVDPLAEQYAPWSPYNYGYDNPIRFIDPDGRSADDIIIRGSQKEQASILAMINEKAAGSFRIDDNGKLYQYESGSYETGSNYYAEKLVEAINDSDVIEVSISETFTAGDGADVSIDVFAGGGVTQKRVVKNKSGEVVAKHARVMISGNENTNLKDQAGYPLEDKPADILAHELVGHAIPYTVKGDTGNAIDNENKVRREQPIGSKRTSNPLRAKDPKHVE